MMKRPLSLLPLVALLAALPAQAHFGLLLPSAASFDEGPATVQLDAAFVHPFEQTGMSIERPQRFDAFVPQADGSHARVDLRDALQPVQILDAEAFRTEFEIERPGVYAFAMQPKPYWEPAEDLFIVHHTKAYVAAFGNEDGWDAPLGLPAEIVPLTRPFGLWEGNVFQGRIYFDGKPLAHAEIEIEYLNEGGRVEAPNDYMITQTVRADADGVFAYAPPGAGWWGFSALHESDDTLEHEGEAKAIEVGAVLWVHFEAWPR